MESTNSPLTRRLTKQELHAALCHREPTSEAVTGHCSLEVLLAYRSEVAARASSGLPFRETQKVIGHRDPAAAAGYLSAGEETDER